MPPAIIGRDREFLPAALEILETPPSPLPVAIMLTLCIFCAVALGWSFIGRLDIHAIAWGKIESAGREKVIQPLESGKVAQFHMRNGSRVQTGDTLVELDSTDARADLAATFETLAANNAEAARRRVAIATAIWIRQAAFGGNTYGTVLPYEMPAIPFSPDISAPIRDRENAVLLADLTQLRDTLSNLDRQTVQKIAVRRRLEAMVGHETDLIATATNLLELREQAIKLAIGTKIALFDAQESLQRSQAQLASDRGALTETDAAIDEIASQKIKAISAFVADNETKLSSVTQKNADLGQQFIKARTKFSHMTLVAPVDGIVQRVAVTTIGQVVLPGQQLMTIVPDQGGLQIQAYVNNEDIGFIKVGQHVEIKIDAFPFAHYGAVGGSILSVAADALDEQAAKREQSNATALADGGYGQPAASPGQSASFVFPIVVALDKATINIDGVAVALKPGMTVSAEIRTGSRRVIDYLLSPIARIGSGALKER
ncbi:MULTISPECIES: HlyD family type I secretion periplasmic adaptor subunit [unclassified Beijerinckia]|uniref:HlyD family type I secretion periplasmic adaptor subunit n=1 Tax=unclassified Beijerinckia TaxID=2638183 RepID=UPI00147DF5AF|nr:MULTISPECIES: HlyD family type I secretion periplasmic adaptor subunit [unclassified Beijerinckia]